MKKLVKLDDKIEVAEELTEEQKKGLWTYRRMIQIVLNNCTPKNNEESMDIHQILLKFRMAEPEIDFEDAQFKIIWDKFDANIEGKTFQRFHGPTVFYLKQCEKSSEQK
jgi:hypothetical protein